MSNDMNVVEAFQKFNGQLIILITGMSGSGKTKLGETLSKDFGIDLINQKDFYRKEHNEKFTLFDGSEVTNWWMDSAYDWDKYNKEVNKLKKGVIVVGLVAPPSKLTFKPDFHLVLSVKKNVLLERMEKTVEKNKEKFPDKYEDVMSGRAKQIFNKLSFPYFLETVEKSDVTKFINATEFTDDELYDGVFDYLIEQIDQMAHKLDKKSDTKKTVINNDDDENNSDSLTSEDTDPLEFIEHKDDGSPYEESDTTVEGGNLPMEVDSYSYGLKGDFIYW